MNLYITSYDNWLMHLYFDNIKDTAFYEMTNCQFNTMIKPLYCILKTKEEFVKSEVRIVSLIKLFPDLHCMDRAME